MKKVLDKLTTFMAKTKLIAMGICYGLSFANNSWAWILLFEIYWGLWFLSNLTYVLISNKKPKQAVLDILNKNFPPSLRKWVRFELDMQRLFWRFIFRRKPRHPRGPLSFLMKSTYPTIAVGLGLLIILEIGLVHPILYTYKVSIWWHVLLIYLSVMSLIYIIGDYQGMLESNHAVIEDNLVLRLGKRSQALIPLANIDSIQFVDISPSERKAKFPDSACLTPFDFANVLLTLKSPTTVSSIIKDIVTNHVFLYLDHPQNILSETKSKSPTPETSQP